MPLRLLLAASETSDQQADRRARTGAASHETFAEAVRAIRGDAALEDVSCVDGTVPETGWLQGFDGVMFPGSPIQMHEETAETRSAARFMEAVLGAGLRAFGSCAGLQIAAVAAGGAVGPREGAMRAAVTRGITRTAAGEGHPLLHGRPPSWDAPAMHSAQVDRLPPGGVALARTPGVPVEAAEIRKGGGVFRGVQYHPEIALEEIAETVAGQADALVDEGLADAASEVRAYADTLRRLGAEAARPELGWVLGLDGETIVAERRRREVANALRWFAEG